VADRPEIAAADSLIVESRMSPELVADLRARGHIVHELGPYRNEMGHAHAIAIDRERGSLAGGSDPRADSLALGY
jgi:gamma-glutamyltranspeptidase/glutathione hydrolase